MSGFESYNDTGFLQFNVDSTAFTPIGSGSLVALDTYQLVNGDDPHDPSSGPYLSTVSDVVTAPTGTDLLAFTTNCWGWCGLIHNNIVFQSQPDMYTVPGNRVPRTNSGGSNEADWVAYQAMSSQTPSSHGTGMQLFNADGTLSWDSNVPIALVAGAYNYTQTDNGASVTISGGPSYLILPGYYFATRSGVQKMFGVNGASVGEFAYNDLGGSSNAIPTSLSINVLGIK